MHEVALSGQSAGLITGLATTIVGIVAIAFAWWNTRATLKQQRNLAFDDRKWQEQRIAYQKIAEWLAGNHLRGTENPFHQLNPFDAWTSAPGKELEATARLFAPEPIIEALGSLNWRATLENEIAHGTQLVITASTATGIPFADHGISKAFKWKGPGDASRDLRELREGWNNARNDLEKALRDVYRPL